MDFKISHPKTFSQYAHDVVAFEKQLMEGWTVITGANSGIGLSLAKLWKNRKLVLIDRDVSQLSEFRDARVIKADLSKPEEIERISIELKALPLRTLVNNAGLGFKGNAGEVSCPKILQTLMVNVYAPMSLVRSLYAHLQKCRSTIVNVGSSVAFFPLPGMSVYAASKAGLVSWSEALAAELAKTNPVVTFCPSGTYTGFQNHAGVKVTTKQKLKSPQSIAAAINASVNSGRSKTVLPGGAFRILYWASHLLPRRTVARLWGALFKAQR